MKSKGAKGYLPSFFSKTSGKDEALAAGEGAQSDGNDEEKDPAEAPVESKGAKSYLPSFFSKTSFAFSANFAAPSTLSKKFLSSAAIAKTKAKQKEAATAM